MKKNRFTLTEIMIALAICFLLAVFLLPRVAKAQPYITNSTAANGAYLPNASVIPAPQPVAVRARQLALGINTGIGQTSNDGTCTNSFATNYVYSTPPVVTVTQTTNGVGGANISGTNVVTAVTTSNFVFNCYNAKTNVLFFWQAIGQ